jgi:hypothetical protein
LHIPDLILKLYVFMDTLYWRKANILMAEIAANTKFIFLGLIRTGIYPMVRRSRSVCLQLQDRRGFEYGFYIVDIWMGWVFMQEDIWINLEGNQLPTS